MKIRLPLLLSLVLCAGVVVAAEEKKDAGKAKATAFDQFKLLAGEWSGKAGEGKDAHEATVTYKVTSGGSAVVETIGPGTEHEMVTVIHPDGDDLILTHYCMLGNQPRMKAPGKADGNKVAFAFVGATNMKSDKEMHMHNVTFTFVDKDTLKAEWTHYMDGKAAAPTVFEMKRKK
jgi:hypothetical protein